MSKHSEKKSHFEKAALKGYGTFIPASELGVKKERFPLVFICSAYSGNVGENIASTCEYCRFALDNLSYPVAPHLHYPWFLRDENPMERELGLLCGLRLMECCSEVWIFGDKLTDGMKREIEYAAMLDKRIRYFNKDFEEEEIDE